MRGGLSLPPARLCNRWVEEPYSFSSTFLAAKGFAHTVELHSTITLVSLVILEMQKSKKSVVKVSGKLQS